MGFKYKLPIPSTALSTTTALITVIPSATRALKITEIFLGGTGTASAANDVGLYRVTTAGTTGTVPITPAGDNPAAPTQGFTNFTTYATQPTLNTKVLDMPVNSNGGAFWYRPIKGDEIEVPAGALGFALRSVSGTGTVAGWITVEEI